MVEWIDWLFMARSGVRGRGRGNARIYGGGSQREKQSSCTSFVSRGESGPASEIVDRDAEGCAEICNGT
jgi:hypothetical protein